MKCTIFTTSCALTVQGVSLNTGQGKRPIRGQGEGPISHAPGKYQLAIQPPYRLGTN